MKFGSGGGKSNLLLRREIGPRVAVNVVVKWLMVLGRKEICSLSVRSKISLRLLLLVLPTSGQQTFFAPFM